jgi:hypothetical protein
MWIRHFIHTLNMAIERGDLPTSARAFYQLDANHNRLPRLTRGADILLWGKFLAEGESARVAAGGAPLGSPSIVEVSAKVAEFSSKQIAQATLSGTRGDNGAAVRALRPAVDALILEICGMKLSSHFAIAARARCAGKRGSGACITRVVRTKRRGDWRSWQVRRGERGTDAGAPFGERNCAWIGSRVASTQNFFSGGFPARMRVEKFSSRFICLVSN